MHNYIRAELLYVDLKCQTLYNRVSYRLFKMLTLSIT